LCPLHAAPSESLPPPERRRNRFSVFFFKYGITSDLDDDPGGDTDLLFPDGRNGNGSFEIYFG